MGVPRFIRHPDLATVVWLVSEAVINHVDKRLDEIMTLVSVDSDVLVSLTSLAQTVDSEVKALLGNPNLNIQPADVSGIQSALSDANDALSTAASAAGQPAPAPVGTDPTAGSTDTPPADGGTAAAPADHGTGAVDPNTGAPADGGTAAPADPNTPVDPSAGGVVA